MFKDGVDVTSGGRLFQTWRPATGKARSPTVECVGVRLDEAAGWRSGELDDLERRPHGRMDQRYDNAQPRRTLYVTTATLNWMQARAGVALVIC